MMRPLAVPGAVLMTCLANVAPAEEGPGDPLPPSRFVNPIAEGADPWVVRHDERYVWCFSEGNRGIAVHVSDSLVAPGPKRVVWRAPDSGPVSREIWAPEIHFLEGRWHVFFAASDGRNENHLAYALRSVGADPLGPYALHGPFATGDGVDGRSPNVWAIDMTVMEHGERRFAIWSGWDAPGTDQQFLYIAPMASPLELAGPRVRLCANDDHLWERTEERNESRGLHEGPQVLQRGGRTFVAYSCGASWLPTYKLGLLELTGDDPLDPGDWTKHPEPVFRSTELTFGVGHACFVSSPDGTEDWIVYHAKRDRRPGWRRGVFIQPFDWTPDGWPRFGEPVAPGAVLERPSGDRPRSPRLPLSFRFEPKTGLEGWSLYAHHQFAEIREDGLHLGVMPDDPINDFRCGEKAVVADGDWDDLVAEASLRIISGGRDAGLVFRATGPSVGYDAQRGYFAGILAGADRVVLGRTDGSSWHEIARASVPIEAGKEYRLAVEAVGDSIQVVLDGDTLIDAVDATWRRGSVGLRVVDTHACFRKIDVHAP